MGSRVRSILSFIIFAAFLFAFAFLFAPTLHAQDAPNNLYLAGGSYSQGGSPVGSGNAFYGHRVGPNTFGFTLIDVLPNYTAGKPLTVTTNIGIGVAQKVVTIAGLPVFVPSSLSISYNSQATGWAYSSGAGVPFPIRKGSRYFVMPTARFEKSNVSGAGYRPIIGIMFGVGQ